MARSREYRNAQAYAAGYRGKDGGLKGAYLAFERERRSPEYQRILSSASDEQGQSRKAMRRVTSDFNKSWAKARADNFRERKRGAFHKLLTYAGLRDPAADYKIGATPFVRRK